MKDEISAAVMFLTRLLRKNENLTPEQIEEFRNCLNTILMERFQNHWFPENPFKGQAYRCIRVNETERRDPILEKAAQDCGLKYEDLKLPVELTIWVDPEEVCCRFGEHKGSFCTVASFKDGNEENYIDYINVDELEQKSIERARQASFEIMGARRSWKKISGQVTRNKNSYNSHGYSQQQQQNILQQLPTLSSQQQQHFQPPVYHPPQALSLYGSSPPSQYLSYSTSPPSSNHHSFYSRGGHHSSNSYSRYPSKYLRGSGSHHNGYSAASSTSTYSQQITHNSYSHGGRNDRYHWVNKSVVKA